jgi:hypothetical protein
MKPSVKTRNGIGRGLLIGLSMCILVALSATPTSAEQRSSNGISSITAATATSPTITKTEGVFRPGATVKAYGTNLGRGSVRVFDLFRRSTDIKGGIWSIFNEAQRPVELRNQSPRTAIIGDYYVRRNPVGLGYLYITASNYREYYTSFYMRLSPGFDISSASSGTHQFKITRLWSTNVSNNLGKINVYPAIGASDGFHIMLEFTKPQVLRSQLQLNRIPDRPSGWHKMSIWYRKNTSPDSNNGKFRIWWDNRLVFDWLTHFQDPANDPSNKITGDFDVDDGNLAGEWSIGNYFSSASSSTWVDFDDIYLSNTIARVELGNASTYGQSTILELQKPLIWNGDGSVTFQVNRGVLNGPMYLYVTNDKGEVNQTGRLVQ